MWRENQVLIWVRTNRVQRDHTTCALGKRRPRLPLLAGGATRAAERRQRRSGKGVPAKERLQRSGGKRVRFSAQFVAQSRPPWPPTRLPLRSLPTAAPPQCTLTQLRLRATRGDSGCNKKQNKWSETKRGTCRSKCYMHKRTNRLGVLGPRRDDRTDTCVQRSRHSHPRSPECVMRRKGLS